MNSIQGCQAVSGQEFLAQKASPWMGFAGMERGILQVESLEEANPAGGMGAVAQPPPEIPWLAEGMVFNPDHPPCDAFEGAQIQPLQAARNTERT